MTHNYQSGNGNIIAGRGQSAVLVADRWQGKQISMVDRWLIVESGRRVDKKEFFSWQEEGRGTPTYGQDTYFIDPSQVFSQNTSFTKNDLRYGW